jgi:NADPH:quinone reductase
VVATANAKDLEFVRSLGANGKLRIEISKVFQLSDAAQAHEFLEHEHFRGKIVFAVREQSG